MIRYCWGEDTANSPPQHRHIVTVAMNLLEAPKKRHTSAVSIITCVAAMTLVGVKRSERLPPR